jgi:putative transposase
LLLVVVIHAANIQESDGAKLVLRRALGRFPRLCHVWVDQGYKPHLVEWARAVGGWVVEIVARPKDQIGFAVVPRRWVVERTFAWLARFRRLSKDYKSILASISRVSPSGHGLPLGSSSSSPLHSSSSG